MNGQPSTPGVVMFERSTAQTFNNSQFIAAGRDHVCVNVAVTTADGGQRAPISHPSEEVASSSPHLNRAGRQAGKRSVFTQFIQRCRTRRKAPGSQEKPHIISHSPTPSQQVQPVPYSPLSSASSDTTFLSDGSSITSIESCSQSSQGRLSVSNEEEVYERSVIPKGHGFPLFRPSPFGAPAKPGDIGILSQDGFQSFGNLYDPRDQEKLSITSPPPAYDSVRQPERLRQGQAIVAGMEDSKSGVDIDHNNPTSCFDFHCRDSHGAVLALTSPADLDTFSRLSRNRLRKYLCSHGAQLMLNLRREDYLDPGQSLYVVTGTIKSDSWGIAVHTSPMRVPYDRVVLNRSEALDKDGFSHYDWTSRGSADARWEASRSVDDDGNRTKDQCLFLRGFLITPSLALEQQLKPDLDESPSAGGSGSDSDHSDFEDRGGSTTRKGRKGRDSNNRSASSSTSSVNDKQHALCGSSSLVHSFPSPYSDSKDYYPSRSINQMLLEDQQVDLAITHDDDWRHLIGDGYLDDLALSNFMADFRQRSLLTVSNGVATVPNRAEGLHNPPPGRCFVEGEHTSSGTGSRPLVFAARDQPSIFSPISRPAGDLNEISGCFGEVLRGTWLVPTVDIIPPASSRGNNDRKASRNIPSKSSFDPDIAAPTSRGRPFLKDNVDLTATLISSLSTAPAEQLHRSCTHSSTTGRTRTRNQYSSFPPSARLPKDLVAEEFKIIEDYISQNGGDHAPDDPAPRDDNPRDAFARHNSKRDDSTPLHDFAERGRGSGASFQHKRHRGMDLLQGLYARLLSSCVDQSTELLHQQPAQWLANHDADIAAIVAVYSDVVPLLEEPGAINTLQRCLFPRMWILGAALSALNGESDTTELRDIQGLQKEIDLISRLGTYRAVKERLRQCVLESREPLSSDSKQKVTPQMLESLMKIDAQHLAAFVLSIITGGHKREQLTAKHDSEKGKELNQNFLGLLYPLLGNSELRDSHDTIPRELVRRSKDATIFPRYLVHPSGSIPQPWSQAEGSFRAVYEGSLDGQPVAVKLLKRDVGGTSVEKIVGSYSREAIVWSQLHHSNLTSFLHVNPSANRDAPANPIPPQRSKRRSGEKQESGSVWATVYSREDNLVLSVASCTSNALGEYPLFIFTAIPYRVLGNQPLISSDMQFLCDKLSQCIPHERIYSVFAFDLLAKAFAHAWTAVTGIEAYTTPFYDCTGSLCTRTDLKPRRQKTILSERGFESELGRASPSDILELGRLCEEFSGESQPFLLTPSQGLLESTRLVESNKVWVHRIRTVGTSNWEIACMAACTRNTASVATITKVYTHPKWRRLGCAERLTRKVCQELFAAGKEKVAVFVGKDNPASHVYEKDGFVELERGGPEAEGVHRWLDLGFDKGCACQGPW